MIRKSLVWIALLGLMTSCLTYYEKTQQFNDHFEKGELKKAEKEISDEEPKQKNRLLHYLNMGTVYFMLGKHDSSNHYFEQAYVTAEDYRQSTGQEVAALITNPKVKTYLGEDHEILLIHYFKALNYIYLNDYDAALVECRRMNIKLNGLNEQYDRENRYKRDAFIHLLMGLIYDANDNYNDAFIAYRNAYDIYQEDYQELFNVSPPGQLKTDLLRTAYLAGMDRELNHYREKFDSAYQYRKNPDQSSLVFFWHNGLGPYKDEFSINFALVRGKGGVAHFKNEEQGWTFPFPNYSDKKEENSGLSDIEVIRMALPKYIERPPFYEQASILVDSQTRYQMEMAENINKIAFQTLQDRMLRELGNALLRLALKKGTEYAVREDSEGVGAALSIFNAVTEQADTRNWQTLPHSISYTRIPVKSGDHTINLTIKNSRGYETTYNLNYKVENGETLFDHFHSIATRREKFYRKQEW